MTYVALGRLDSYLGLDPRESEVYVLRLGANGIPITKLSDALAVVKAVGMSFKRGSMFRDMDYDVRGIVLQGWSPDSWMLDVICTYVNRPSILGPYLKSADDIREELNGDSELKAWFPQLNVQTAGWYYLAGDEVKGEVAYWLSAPVLWDQTVRGGQTTLAFDQQQGVWYGTADKRQRQWSPPYVPPFDGGGGQQPASSSNWWWLGLGALAVAGIAVYGSRRKKR